jgi:peptide/nickel transport system permease protein
MNIAEWVNRRNQKGKTSEFGRQRQLTHVIYVILRDPLAVFSILVITLFIVVAVFGSKIAPFPEEGMGKTNMATRLLPPSATHLLGTDRLGRDMLSRIIIATRPALWVSLMVVFLALLIGAPLGALAGYVGGHLDDVIMRVTDLFLAFPFLLLALMIVTALGPGLKNAALALAISWWPWYTRLVRNIAASLKQRYYIDAARAAGVPAVVIIFRHILPNCISPILVQMTVDLGTVILATSSLAFLGLGVQPPAPDWGLMVNEGRAYILTEWWYSTFPGLAIFLTVLAFNLLGDVLRDILDPRQYR